MPSLVPDPGLKPNWVGPTSLSIRYNNKQKFKDISKEKA